MSVGALRFCFRGLWLLTNLFLKWFLGSLSVYDGVYTLYYIYDKISP